MAYDSRVYRILIASPSDVTQERDAAVKVIQDWNDLHSASRQITLLPLRWETHTAPEYGTRPQEVINRMVVDDCDLVVGIFWTRIGSPTGVADSGTLEEIERVGKAHKPVMLYFSSVGADPARIDIKQLERLNQFREQTFPNGLIESYKTALEFRDKFSMQLERKVRELKEKELSGQHPLTLQFVSVETGELIGTHLSVIVDRPKVEDFSDVPEAHRKTILARVQRRVDALTYVPIPIAVMNPTGSSVKSLYVELEITASTDDMTISDDPKLVRSSGSAANIFSILSSFDYFDESDAEDETLSQVVALQRQAKLQLDRYSSDKLQRVGNTWKLLLEWDAIQPQRVRMIKPLRHALPRGTGSLDIHARVYADSAPAPFSLAVRLDITVVERTASVEDVLPRLANILEELANPDKASAYNRFLSNSGR